MRPDLQGSRRATPRASWPSSCRRASSRIPPSTRGCAARRPVRRPLLSRRHHAVPRRRCARGWPQLDNLAAQMGVRLVATNDVHYHVPERRALHDVVTAIRLELHGRGAGLPPLRLGRAASQAARGDGAAVPPAIRARSSASAEIVDRCHFSLDQLTYQYPVEYEGGETPMQKLERLTWKGAAWRYPEGVPDKVASTIRHEFDLIERKKIAPYFLTVHEIVDAGARDGHPLPGPRLGRQFRRLLLPAASPRSIPTRTKSCSSASCPTSATSRPTSTSISSTSGARRSSSGSTRTKGRTARRPGRHGDRLSQPQRHPRRRQGARPVARHGGRDGRHGLGHAVGSGVDVEARAARPASIPRIRGWRWRSNCRPTLMRLSAPSLAACRRLRADRRTARRAGADPERGHGGPHRHRMGQGRSRRARRSTRSTCWRSAC